MGGRRNSSQLGTACRRLWDVPTVDSLTCVYFWCERHVRMQDPSPAVMSVDLAAAAREALASQNDQIARFEVWKYNKIKPKKKRTVAVDMRQKLLYCLDKRELRKPILPLKKLVTVHDDFADSPLLVLEFEKGIKKYKFEFLELAEKNRFWVILQRFCSKPSAGPASQGVGDSGSPSAGARGRRASISDRLFRRRSAGPSTTMSAQAITKTRRELETCVASFLVTKFTRFGDRQRLFALDVDRSVRSPAVHLSRRLASRSQCAHMLCCWVRAAPQVD